MPACFGGRRTLVQVQPPRLRRSGPIAHGPARLAGAGAWLRQSAERSGLNPGGWGFDSLAGHRICTGRKHSLRSGLESGFQHGLISRSTPVQIRPPQLHGLEVLRPHAALVSAEDRVRSPAGPLHANGDACTEGARVPRTHPALGSTPIVSTDRQGACGPTGRRQPGVLVMRVQLPPGPLDTEGSRIRFAGPVC